MLLKVPIKVYYEDTIMMELRLFEIRYNIHALISLPNY